MSTPQVGRKYHGREVIKVWRVSRSYTEREKHLWTAIRYRDMTGRVRECWLSTWERWLRKQ